MDLAHYGHATLTSCEDPTACSTCGDVAVPVRVVALHDRVATVEDRVGSRADVLLDLVPGAGVGDALLVHAGVALRRLEEAS